MTKVMDNGIVRDATPEEETEIAARAGEAQKPVIPAAVTRRQARQALLLAGLLDKVQPAIDGIEDPVARSLAQIEWDDSQAFERARPVLIQLGAAIGLDAAGLDKIFVDAEKL